MDTKRKISKGEILLLCLTALFLCAMTLLAHRDQAAVTQVRDLTPTESNETMQSREERTLLLDINSATEEELTELPGIGQTLAERIVAYRNINGPFVSEEDLLHVSGIGETKLEQIRPYIRLGSG